MISCNDENGGSYYGNVDDFDENIKHGNRLRDIDRNIEVVVITMGNNSFN